jgi:hypothetical protein
MINGSPDDLVEHVWDIQLQYGVDGEILLSWDPSSLDYLGSFILEDAFGGMMFSVDMSTQSELQLDNPAFTILKVRVTPAVFFEWVYTPEPEYVGEEEFTYRAFDGELYSDIATVTITITPVNDAPVVTVLGEPFETDEETALAIDIVVSDIDGDLAVLSVVSDPLHGTGDMVDNGGGSYTYTYTPSDGYVGSDAVIIQAQETETEEQLYSDQVNIQIMRFQNERILIIRVVCH